MVTPINRRTFLRASGVAMALPLLESMHPALARAAAESPKRMVNICTTLGLYPSSWFPESAGPNYEVTEYLQLLDHHRDKYTLFSGFSHEEQSGRQPHNSENTFMTAARHPGLDGFQNSISVDQAAANHLGYVTRYPSLVLATSSPQSQSYTSNGVMIPAEVSPSKLFTNMFLAGSPEEVKRKTRSLGDGGSILDHLKSETTALRQRVSAIDQQTLDDYFEAVRFAERDLAEAGAWLHKPKPVVDAPVPTDIPSDADLVGRINSMFNLIRDRYVARRQRDGPGPQGRADDRRRVNLIPLVLETDTSRVVSVMVQDHKAVRPVRHAAPADGGRDRRVRPEQRRVDLGVGTEAARAGAVVRHDTRLQSNHRQDRRRRQEKATWANEPGATVGQEGSYQTS